MLLQKKNATLKNIKNPFLYVYQCIRNNTKAIIKVSSQK